MKVQVLTLEEAHELSARFHAARSGDPGLWRNDWELAEQAKRRTALFFWRDETSFNWLCPGRGSWHDGQIGAGSTAGRRSGQR